MRYLTERFLPDKAIDLIDESAAKLRLEMNSVPQEVDEIERRIRQLEIEREAIRREGDDRKVAELSETIASLSEERNRMRAKWQEEKNLIDGIQKNKVLIEELNNEAAQAERQGKLWQGCRNSLRAYSRSRTRNNAIKTRVGRPSGTKPDDKRRGECCRYC